MGNDRGNPKQFCVEIYHRSEETIDQTLTEACHRAGVTGVTACQVVRLFFLQGEMQPDEIEQLAQDLLADSVTETFVLSSDTPSMPSALANPSSPTYTVDVTLLPGVTDPAAENLLRAARMTGIAHLARAASGQRYLVWGTVQRDEIERLVVDVFSNPVIQRATINQSISPPFVPVQEIDATVETIPLRNADDATLFEISKNRRLALDINEMQAIRAWYQHEQRDPTDAELETLAQTWSEHCVHKTFKALISFATSDPEHLDQTAGEQQTIINGLLRSYIRGATEKIAKPWIRSAFVDNAGIIAFDERWDLAFKVETHNHPSALEPFGGANTGVGGVVRDILGVSARPIANTDVLCFGPPDMVDADVPEGVLHPRRIAEGVVYGVEDYGNKMGIPTVNGAIVYHQGYTSNPLVFCGCLGLLPTGSHPTTPQAGDYIVVIGGRTGRDGLRGATFSSMEMDQTTGEIAGSAVQIGHPINEKQVQEVVLRARDEQLYHAITDCGAGGLASAVGEMGRHLGAHVRLETVPLKYPGLRPWEIWLSEAQERMVLAVSAHHWPRLQAIAEGQDVEAVCIGTFEQTGRLKLFYDEMPVGDLAMDFLHDGIPQRQLEAVWPGNGQQHLPGDGLQPSKGGSQPSLAEVLLALLAHPNIRSKEAVVRRYDHEVQGGTVVKPLVGVANCGPGDAAVLVPLDVTDDRIQVASSDTPDAPPETCSLDPVTSRAVALGVGICPTYGEYDPYAMAWAAVDEAMRNVVAVGADPDQVALLDNFCWGNPTLPDRLGSLVRCAQGCHDAAIAYNAPFVSGKDSLNNEYSGSDGKKHAIPGTLLISSLGIVPDAQQTTTMDLKQPGNVLYVVGDTRPETGGSHYHLVGGNSGSGRGGRGGHGHAHHSGGVPQPVQDALERLRVVHRAIAGELVRACHDCSEGGLGVALAEMCLAGRAGAEVDLSAVPGADAIGSDDVVLFSESLCRFIVEVRPDDAEAFELLCEGVPHARIGHVGSQEQPQHTPALHIRGVGGNTVVQVPVAQLERAWRGEELAALDDDTVGTATGYVAIPYSPYRVTSVPRVLILHANGTNRDREAAQACRLLGAQPEIVHVNQLLSGERHVLDYQMLIIPGGFSYGDDLGAGTLWALDLRHHLDGSISTFVASGRPVLGICNGFQALVKAGLLPGGNQAIDRRSEQSVTLAPNESGHFECRWVYLRPNPASPCLFTYGIDDLVYCPVAHGEGRLVTRDDAALAAVQAGNLVALTYGDASGNAAEYPLNPNGSVAGIAGLCNPAGNVLGLMPHPEDHILPWQHPRWHRGESGMSGLRLFENGIKSC